MALSHLPATPNGPKRLPRFRRAKQPPTMVLMERDLAILLAVLRYRLLTREQIQRLLFPGCRAEVAQRRLKLLFHHGLLERIAAPVDPKKWAMLPVYRLSAEGARVVAQAQGITVAH